MHFSFKTTILIGAILVAAAHARDAQVDQLHIEDREDLTGDIKDADAVHFADEEEAKKAQANDKEPIAKVVDQEPAASLMDSQAIKDAMVSIQALITDMVAGDEIEASQMIEYVHDNMKKMEEKKETLDGLLELLTDFEAYMKMDEDEKDAMVSIQALITDMVAGAEIEVSQMIEYVHDHMKKMEEKKKTLDELLELLTDFEAYMKMDEDDKDAGASQFITEEEITEVLRDDKDAGASQLQEPIATMDSPAIKAAIKGIETLINDKFAGDETVTGQVSELINDITRAMEEIAGEGETIDENLEKLTKLIGQNIQAFIDDMSTKEGGGLRTETLKVIEDYVKGMGEDNEDENDVEEKDDEDF